ncbi:hypothetical protein PQQ86_25915 [Paraburkholderia sediminicola]|uniref:hypothetical protein n=1 Tax=Paraburkholderia sediminicola TaxID=458836 RepID=UPI0038B844C7
MKTTNNKLKAASVYLIGAVFFFFLIGIRAESLPQRPESPPVAAIIPMSVPTAIGERSTHLKNEKEQSYDFTVDFSYKNVTELKNLLEWAKNQRVHQGIENLAALDPIILSISIHNAKYSYYLDANFIANKVISSTPIGRDYGYVSVLVLSTELQAGDYWVEVKSSRIPNNLQKFDRQIKIFHSAH